MARSRYLDLGVDFRQIRCYADYKQVWKRLYPVRVTMIAKDEPCPYHDIGDTFIYKSHYDKPKGICSALHHVVQLYVLRTSLGFPSWEDDPSVYRVRCPEKNGTTWEMRRDIVHTGGKKRGKRMHSSSPRRRTP
jgi:uncharacterized repeat protein (TIGR04076 family)